MQWILTASRFLLNRSTAWRKSITPSAFACVLFLACSLPFSSALADDFEEFEETNSVLRIEDLTPEARVAVSNLALALSSSGDPSTTATIDDNVAAILALLQSAIYSTGSIITQPMYNQTQLLGAALMRMLTDAYWNNTSLPQQSQSFLYQIQRALYGQVGNPSSSQAVLPVLWRMESALTNDQTSVDMGWTNRLASLPLILSQLDGTSQNGFSLSEWIDRNRNVEAYLYSLQTYLSTVVRTHSAGPYNSTYLDVFDAALADVWEPDAQNASKSASALRVVDANVLSALSQLDSTLSQLDSTLSDVGSDVSDIYTLVGNGLELNGSDLSSIEDYTWLIHHDDLEYFNTDRSVQRDFRLLHQQLGVENPSRTNNIYYLLSRLFDDSSGRSIVAATGSVIASEINAAKSSAESSVASSSNIVARIADDEEPDWEHDRYTGDNPLDTGDSIFDLPLQQARSLLPDLPESLHKEIVLYRGDFPIFGGASSRSRGRSVRLDVSYPLEHFDDVSSGMVSLRSIMEWVWQLCSAVLCVSMLFRFYTSLATDKLNMEADAAMGV